VDVDQTQISEVRDGRGGQEAQYLGDGRRDHIMEMELLGEWKVPCAIGNNNFEGNDGRADLAEVSPLDGSMASSSLAGC
jgi:hypothetical protein